MSDADAQDDEPVVTLPLVERDRLVDALRGVRRDMIRQRTKPAIADTDRRRQLDDWERTIRDTLGKLEAAPVQAFT